MGREIQGTASVAPVASLGRPALGRHSRASWAAGGLDRERCQSRRACAVRLGRKTWANAVQTPQTIVAPSVTVTAVVARLIRKSPVNGEGITNSSLRSSRRTYAPPTTAAHARADSATPTR